MRKSIEYNGHTIESTTQLKGKPHGWTLEVRITPSGRAARTRRCRAPNLYATKDLAVTRSLEFGRRIVDGKLRPRTNR